MKKLTLLLLVACSLVALPTVLFAQGRSISLQKKILTPYVTYDSDTLSVGDEIMLTKGTGTDGKFLFVQLLNGFNEPIQPADSRMAYRRSKIVFFKEDEGNMYAFTKFFVVNVEAAFAEKEAKKAEHK
jgi:hypothetical protein